MKVTLKVETVLEFIDDVGTIFSETVYPGESYDNVKIIKDYGNSIDLLCEDMSTCLGLSKSIIKIEEV